MTTADEARADDALSRYYAEQRASAEEVAEVPTDGLVSALAESIERLIQPVLHTSLGSRGYGSPRMTVAVCRSCGTPNAGTEGHADGCPVPAAKALLKVVRSA